MEEIAQPAIGNGDVLVRVHAAGVNMGVWHMMTGTIIPRMMKAATRERN
jgi:NADPH:quinone reductase-like Zn-dependent oxidoreductase